ncbi:hypothetical protein CYY_003596 [Polysphondylium violaceum]|uniref:Transmembrane protein n=1 Tax=Polysphondylium violaceum TaxID=133409 RepID=A0A8J4V8J4_9MYCE|nr:hypothetical protein CYY_003596 [Polysphondylium violaceum]
MIKVLIFIIFFSGLVLSDHSGVGIWSQGKNTIVVGSISYDNQTTNPMVTLNGYTYPGDQQFSSYNYNENILTFVSTNQVSNQMNLISINCTDEWSVSSILPIGNHLTLGGLAYNLNNTNNDPNNLFITVFNFGILKIIKLNPFTGSNVTIDQFPGVFQSAVFNQFENYYAVSYANHTITTSLSNNYIRYYYYNTTKSSYQLLFKPTISIFTFGPYKMKYHPYISQVIGLLQYYNPSSGILKQVFSSLTSSNTLSISNMSPKGSLYIISVLPSFKSSQVYTIAQNINQFYLIIFNYTENIIQDIIPISEPIVEIF